MNQRSKILIQKYTKGNQRFYCNVNREKSVENAINGRVVVDMRNVPRAYFKSEVFSDNGKQTIYKELMRNKFSFPLEDPIQWKVGGETKMIESYLCKKATGKYKGRHYIAWFTESIPIPDESLCF
ncbi:GLPGLI family protein [Chryseobacterium wanjuense]